jgi:hypothetical protein
MQKEVQSRYLKIKTVQTLELLRIVGVQMYASNIQKIIKATIT